LRAGIKPAPTATILDHHAQEIMMLCIAVGKLDFFEFLGGSFGLIGFGKAFDDFFKD
jgi:hypothetical protein